MMHTRNNEAHHNNVTAYAIQGRQPQSICLAGMRKNVRSALSALQHRHSGVLIGDQSTLGYPNVKVIRGCLSSGAFGAQRILQGPGTLLQS